jgi:hypothetical protein
VLTDRLDIELHDREQLQEIQLLTDLILACSTGPTRLSKVAIDAALGLTDAASRNVE